MYASYTIQIHTHTHKQKAISNLSTKSTKQKCIKGEKTQGAFQFYKSNITHQKYAKIFFAPTNFALSHLHACVRSTNKSYAFNFCFVLCRVPFLEETLEHICLQRPISPHFIYLCDVVVLRVLLQAESTLPNLLSLVFIYFH